MVKTVTIQQIFEELQKNIINIQSNIMCLDTTSIKVHPNVAGVKKSSCEQRPLKRRLTTKIYVICVTEKFVFEIHFLQEIVMMCKKEKIH